MKKNGNTALKWFICILFLIVPFFLGFLTAGYVFGSTSELEYISFTPDTESVRGEGSVTRTDEGDKYPEKRGELRAVWVAGVFNLNLPSAPALSSDALIREADELVLRAEKNGINTLIVQVRACSDAFYPSDIFPSSHFLTGKQGEKIEFDVFGYLIEKAHERGIAVFAWVNPYRVTTASMSKDMLSPENPAVRSEWLTYSTDGCLYYDPGLPEVRRLVVDGVLEICDKYRIDGIAFDDYFYAEGITNEDLATYERYGEGESLFDFRRKSVSALIEDTYNEIKARYADIIFLVSVRGIWQNSYEDERGSSTNGNGAYNSIYCDALDFIEKKCIDIISPQIYWSFEYDNAPFAVLANWWAEKTLELSDGKVGLLISLAAYSLDRDEIKAQTEYARRAGCYEGFALYNASCLE